MTDEYGIWMRCEPYPALGKREDAMLSDVLVSYIRTFTPALVGLVVGWLVARGLPVAPGLQDGLTALLSGAAIAVYYAAVRWLEARWKGFGWLLGVPKAPAYRSGPEKM